MEILLFFIIGLSSIKFNNVKDDNKHNCG